MSKTLVLRAEFLILLFGSISLIGCSPWKNNCDKLRKVEPIFDGGSLVFNISGIELSQKNLMISPVTTIDPATGGIIEENRVNVYLVRGADNRYFDEIVLREGSPEETVVIEYLQNCRRYFHEHQDTWNVKVDALIQIIQNRNNKLPDVLYRSNGA